MKQMLDYEDVIRDSLAYRGTGGVSAENSVYGFRPAFLDRDTGRIHLCDHPAGDALTSHRFDGLPAECITARDAQGRPSAIRSSLVAGFEREGYFFTREQAAQLIQWELDKLAS
jgi:hypothetical protein